MLPASNPFSPKKDLQFRLGSGSHTVACNLGPWLPPVKVYRALSIRLLCCLCSGLPENDTALLRGFFYFMICGIVIMYRVSPLTAMSSMSCRHGEYHMFDTIDVKRE